MKDLVEILENYCQLKNIHFVYGRKPSLNLLDNSSKLENNKVYLMLEPFNRDIELTNVGVPKSYLFGGTFFLVVNSNLDMPIYNEKSNNKENAKYILNVKPLLELSKEIASEISCNGLEILKFSSIDVYDIFDQNKDGILVNFSIRSNE